MKFLAVRREKSHRKKLFDLISRYCLQYIVQDRLWNNINFSNTIHTPWKFLFLHVLVAWKSLLQFKLLIRVKKLRQIHQFDIFQKNLFFFLPLSTNFVMKAISVATKRYLHFFQQKPIRWLYQLPRNISNIRKLKHFKKWSQTFRYFDIKASAQSTTWNENFDSRSGKVKKLNSERFHTRPILNSSEICSTIFCHS